MKNKYGFLLVFLVLVFLALDQFSKARAVKSVNLVWRNRGLVGGLFFGDQTFLNTYFTAFFLLLSGWLALRIWRGRKKDWFLVFSLSLYLAGALANFGDRIFRGYVIDFLDLKWFLPGYFNLADVFIFLGVVLLVGRFFLMGRS